jgi:hypothetical protein
MTTTKTSIRADQMKPGFIMSHYGVTFRITEVKIYGDSWNTMQRDEFGPPLPCYVGKTELIEYPEDGSVMPLSWAKDWTFQGNCRAHFTRITNEA